MQEIHNAESDEGWPTSGRGPRRRMPKVALPQKEVLMRFCHAGVLALAFLHVGLAVAGEQVLTPRLHHLRAGDQPEWADFPRQAEGPSLRLHFRSQAN